MEALKDVGRRDEYDYVTKSLQRRDVSPGPELAFRLPRASMSDTLEHTLEIHAIAARQNAVADAGRLGDRRRLAGGIARDEAGVSSGSPHESLRRKEPAGAVAMGNRKSFIGSGPGRSLRPAQGRDALRAHGFIG